MKPPKIILRENTHKDTIPGHVYLIKENKNNTRVPEKINTASSSYNMDSSDLAKCLLSRPTSNGNWSDEKTD